ncbi:MAG: CDP-alcohol phosphatidyltransferase family protein [Deltaproteobacteria bacterium]|nr:CDP-alcohol phosphatidyltransferase family protein [Deltaproteobacteria bacterium]
MNLPNIISLARILFTPVVVILLVDEDHVMALVVFAIAGITDGLDGLLARVLHQRTILGSYLDPIADKLLLLASFITLAFLGKIPVWLVVVVISRDVIIVSGILVLVLNDYKLTIEPTIISKMTTVFQIGTVLAVLCKGFLFHDPLILLAFYWVTALLTILSGLDYVRTGVKMAGTPPRT